MKARSSAIAIVGIFILWTCVGMADEKGPLNVTFVPTSQGKGMSTGHGLLCMKCHTPDSPLSAKGSENKTVLWNYEESGVAFDMYVTMAENKGDLDGPSKLCLSCHDGVTAPDHFGGDSRGSFLFNRITNLIPSSFVQIAIFSLFCKQSFGWCMYLLMRCRSNLHVLAM